MTNISYLVTCISIALLKSSTFALAARDLNTTPKVLFYNEKLHSFGSSSNSTHIVQKYQRLFRFRCQSEYPNRWLWTTKNEFINYIEINKTRDKDTFISDLLIHVGDLIDGKDKYNFSCQQVNTTIDHDIQTAYQPVTCLQIKKSDENTTSPEIFMSFLESYTPLGKCIHNDFDHAAFCNSTKLEIDLTNMRAKCPKNQHFGNRSCADLDTCYSIRANNAVFSTKYGECKGTFGNVGGHNVITGPLNGSSAIIFCDEYIIDVYWMSFLHLYPGFKHKNSLRQMYFFRTMNESLRNHAVLLHALSLSESHQFSQLTHVVGRNHFADNESVEFYCFAVKSLFMKGFRWKWTIGSNTTEIPPGNETDIHEIDDNLHIHIVKRNITLHLHTDKNGTIERIVCEAPVWNSREWQAASVNVTISHAISPISNLTKMECNRTSCALNCTFEGWPLPEIAWNITEQYGKPLTVTNQSLPTPNDGMHDQKPKKGWHQILIVKKPLSVTDYICIVKNWKGSAQSNVIRIEGSSSLMVIIISAISCSIIAVLVAGLGVVYWRYRQKLHLYTQQQNLTVEEINEFYGGASPTTAQIEALVLAYNSAYEIPREQLQIDDALLGSGQFGVVLKGSIGPLAVAVKTVKPSADLIHFKSLLAEIKILQYVGTHRNIVNLIGANTNNIHNREVYMVLDYCSNGNLVNFLRECRDRFVDFFNTSGSTQEVKSWPLYENSKEVTLTTGNLITFGCEISSAMDHLASKNVIHGDLAARNILVTDDLHIKISDFGLAKQLLHYSVYVQKIDCPLPLRWMAIESLQDMEFSLASDKWSYGVCLWEIFSLAELPYPGTQWGFESYKMLQEGYRMEKPRYANDSVYQIMLDCWHIQPQERPNFQDIIRQLQREEEMLT